MNVVRWFSAVVLAAVAAPVAPAQEAPKPGPEHEVLKKMVGDWDVTMKIAGMEVKGTITYKMDLGGLWLLSSLESELFGTKFSGRGMDTYDAGRKKYVGVWIDSMATSPLVTEGDYDKATKTLTMAGTGPGMDGKPTKYRAVTKFTHADTIDFIMYTGDKKEPDFTLVYKRRK